MFVFVVVFVAVYLPTYIIGYFEVLEVNIL